MASSSRHVARLTRFLQTRSSTRELWLTVPAIVSQGQTRCRNITSNAAIPVSRPSLPRRRSRHPSATVQRKILASYSTQTDAATHTPTADDLIQELQDLYEIAQDELEIAAESTAASTIYGPSDRVTLREAFDDLDRVYSAYTQEPPHPTREYSADDAEATRPNTRFDPGKITPEIREEIKRRIGQRLREMRNAVEALEESAKAE